MLSTRQESFIYLPNQQDFNHCAAYDSTEIALLGNTRAYYKKTSDKLAVFYHGNAGSACDRKYIAELFEQNGYSYLIVEYEGYSNDTKKPTHAGLKQNVNDVVDFINSKPFTEVLVAGESIGSGPASLHTSLGSVQKLILIAPFSSLKDLASEIYWFYPTSILVNNAFDNPESLNSFSGSSLIIHGNNDTTIPQKFGKKLFESINTKEKLFISIDGAGHNNLFSYKQTLNAINQYLSQE